MLGVGTLFDAAAPDYDGARRVLVPGFDGFYGAAVESIPFERDEALRVLDLGAGTGLLSEMVAGRFPNSRVTLVDVSVEMLRVARRRFAGEAKRFEFRVMDHARKPLPGRPYGYDLVVSALSIHHLTHGDKRELFEKVYRALANGGWFVNADQVLGPTPEAEQEYQEDWLRRVREAGVSDGELSAALTRMKADKNAALEAQMAWLRDAGFGSVEHSYADGRFAVYGGRKGSRRRKEITHDQHR